MAEIHFHENKRNCEEPLDKDKGLCDEKGIIDILAIPSELCDDAYDIISALCASVGDGVAFAYLDEVLYSRIFDGEKYLFPLPFMLSENADAEAACKNLAYYARREMIPLIITDVPRDEIEFVCSVFPHVDAYCYEDDDDSFYLKVNNECDMLDSVPSVELDGITLGELRDADKEAYAELCRDRDLNKFWGYDAYQDNPSGDADFYLNVVRREFNSGVAITLAVREGELLVGEATVYGFDYCGSASIAVRILRNHHSRGIGSRATKALIKLSRDIGLSEIRAEILNENESSIKMTAKYMELEKRDLSKTYFALSL